MNTTDSPRLAGPADPLCRRDVHEVDARLCLAVPEEHASETQPQARKFLRTHINLVEGEITNKIGSEIIGDNLYQKAQQFHIQQVSQGHQTITHNLESLQQILRLMTVLEKQKQGESY